jgi:hypothetical protein
MSVQIANTNTNNATTQQRNNATTQQRNNATTHESQNARLDDLLS